MLSISFGCVCSSSMICNRQFICQIYVDEKTQANNPRKKLVDYQRYYSIHEPFQFSRLLRGSYANRANLNNWKNEAAKFSSDIYSCCRDYLPRGEALDRRQTVSLQTTAMMLVETFHIYELCSIMLSPPLSSQLAHTQWLFGIFSWRQRSRV